MREHAFSRNFLKVAQRRFSKLLGSKTPGNDASSEIKPAAFAEEEVEKYRGAKEQDKRDEQYGIHKDLKKRVFMVIKAPKGRETKPNVYMIDNKNHFPKIKFPKYFLISRENIFFWNLQFVYSWNFSKMTSSSSVPIVKEVGFSIPNEDWERSIIKNVSTSGRDLVDQKLII